VTEVKLHAKASRPWYARVHKWTGIFLLLPLLVWAVTGSIFLTKPGYDQAYEKLPIKTYAENFSSLPLSALSQQQKGWQQVRRLNTIVGEHLLVQKDGEWQQLNSADGSVRSESEFITRQLMEDAFSINPERYGQIQSLDGLQAITDSGVVVTLDWHTMSLKQRGDDTRSIQQLYRWHYLQWTGHEEFDRWLGLSGLIALFGLTLLGLRLLFK